MYDVIIIGAGGTGMSASIYTTRYDLKTLILTKDIGGQASLTDVIENYPGFESINGAELMMKFKAHAEKFGAEIKMEPVAEIKIKQGGFDVIAQNGASYKSKTVIVTSGLEHRKLGVRGEDKFYGKGVAYCATCDAPLYKGNVTAVAGGGNSALEAAEILGRICKKVYAIIRDSEYLGEKSVLQKILKNAKIEKHYNSEILEIKGGEKVSAILVKNNKTGETSELKTDGVFVQIGWQAKTEWLKDLVERTEKGEIITSVSGETKTPGLFAAGDVTKIPTKQLIVSAGEGAKAGLRAVQYIREGN